MKKKSAAPACEKRSELFYSGRDCRAFDYMGAHPFEQDGESMTVTTDAPHPVQYDADGMPTANVDEPTEVTASFDEPATYVDVMRYAEDDLAAAAEEAGSAQDVAASDVVGEIIDANLGEDGTVGLTVEPGYRYALEVSFENGICTYVFTVR